MSGTALHRSLHVLAVVVAALSASCSNETADVTSGLRTVTGSASKGPLQGATIEFFQIDGAGNASGEPLATVPTNESGGFVATDLPSGMPLLARSSGGSYVDEADPNTDAPRKITLGINDVLESVLPANSTSLTITPYSMAMLQKARNQAAGSNFGAVYAATVIQATQAFGFNPITVLPANPTHPSATATTAQRRYALLLGASAQVINAIAFSAGRYPGYADIIAFVDDLADGRLDSANLANEVRRFRNNNIARYSSVSATTVDETLLSQPAQVSQANSPVSGTPSISGTPTEDQVLTAVTSGISDANGLGSFSYQWRRNGSPISGATSQTYMLGDLDVGANISVTVSFTDGGGQAESTTSSTVGPVANVNDTPTGSPTISGTASQGQSLTAVTSGIADADGLGTFSYQWNRDGSPIGGATSSSYTLVAADVGKAISVTVSYTDGHGTLETLTSAQTALVTATNSPPSGSVTIDGTPTEDEVLTANTSTISDPDGPPTPAYSYQWKRNGSPIGGALSSTYTPGDADVGTTITVTVSYTDGGGTVENLTSNGVGPIANVNDPPTSIAPTSVNTAEDTTFAFISSNQLSVDDVDDPTLVVSLSVTAGTLNLSNTTGISFGTGDGVADTSMTFDGTVADLNNALASLTYTPAPNDESGTTLTFSVDDGGPALVRLITISITPVNDAPVLNAAPAVALNAVTEDSPPPSGAVGTPVSALVDFPGGGGYDNVTDPDSGAVLGIAIQTINLANGAWWYSIDDGTSWALVTGVSATNALLIAAGTGRLHFEPDPDFNGATGVIFRAWDTTSGTNGGRANVSAASGGTTAFSTATDSANLTVTPVNDAPTLDLNLGLAATQGAATVLDNSALSASDIDSTDTAITFNITTPPANGNIEISSVTVTSFTQAELTSGVVKYVHDNSATTTDSFQFTLEDGTDFSQDCPTPSPCTFNITVAQPLDSDGDGLTDDVEGQLGTNPNNPDTDGDGLSDFEEVNRDGNPDDYTPGTDTDPNDPDTDGDGVSDWIETKLGSDPFSTNVVRFVSGFNGSDANGGTGWGNEFQTLQRAIVDLDGLGPYPATQAAMYYVLADGSSGSGPGPLDLTGATPGRQHLAIIGGLGSGVYVPASTTLMNGSGSAPTITVSNATSINIQSFDIRNGLSSLGGGLYLHSGDGAVEVTLRDSIVQSNQAVEGDGGGAAVIGGGATFRVEGSIFRNNVASGTSVETGRGGAIYAANFAIIDIFGSRFISNNAFNQSGPSATHGGGALYMLNSTLVADGGSVFASNFGGNGPGGAINIIEPLSVTLNDNQFLSNESLRPGGALHIHQNNDPGAVTRIFNNLFVGNATVDTVTEGGAIEIEHGNGSLEFQFNTIAYNQMVNDVATGVGGGVAIFPANGTDFRHNIIWFNDNANTSTAETGDNLYLDGVGTTTFPSHNNVDEDGFGGNFTQTDPQFEGGFYLVQSANASVDGGDDDATVPFAGYNDFTTRADGVDDSGTVDLGFHHSGPADGAASSAQVFASPQTAGCPAATLGVLLRDSSGQQLSHGHLVVADNLSGPGGSLASLTTLDPRGTGTSVLARDSGDGFYRFDLTGSSAGSFSMNVYVDGSTTPVVGSFTCN